MQRAHLGLGVECGDGWISAGTGGAHTCMRKYYVSNAYDDHLAVVGTEYGEGEREKMCNTKGIKETVILYLRQ